MHRIRESTVALTSKLSERFSFRDTNSKERKELKDRKKFYLKIM